MDYIFVSNKNFQTICMSVVIQLVNQNCLILNNIIVQATINEYANFGKVLNMVIDDIFVLTKL